MCEGKKISPFFEAPPEVEITHREKDGQPYTFVLNHSEDSRRIHLGEREWKDLLSGSAVSGEVELPARGVMILQT
ncbi:Beta-galactosidase C-terminal domain [Paenibacillus sp. P26]|nr:Beta-galactosidase C-terminal domain [Paenibacillus sp. P26]UUZ97360.1 Beta-galactosidase C-terminal domain [Paenibacillus sp. P25]